MKLIQLKLRNFRCYKQEVVINFDDMTVFVGRNDAGKSTILDALDIFFSESGAPDKHDASKGEANNDIEIKAIFSDLPETLILDQKEPTSLQAEHLLNADGNLEICKTFNGALEKPKLIGLSLYAMHPTASQATDLLKLNNADLKKRSSELSIDTTDIDQRANAQLRAAIRDKIGALDLQPSFISLMENNGQNVWKGILAELPAFALFKSDRVSTDQDPEAQDPLNAAIKDAVRQKEAELNVVFEHVQQEVKKIADLTLAKLKEMDPDLASTFSPQFLPPKWASIFKASITGDAGIPINKRGSGVRRLVLLNFFRAKAEQLMRDSRKSNAIYAVEEPETSQHPRNQRMLISALQQLAGNDQVILTTHNPVLARMTYINGLRFVHTKDDGSKEVLPCHDEQTRNLIAQSLGVLPDHNVKMFIGVEGQTDVSYMKRIAGALIASGASVPNLEQLELDGYIIFVPLGGSCLAYWANSNPMQPLNRPEFHVYDRDTQPPANPKYDRNMAFVNARPNCKALATNKREIENYVHIDAVNEALAEIGVPVNFAIQFGDFDNVPALLADRLNLTADQGNKWGDRKAKEFLCNLAASKMTKQRLDEIDPTGEVENWFSHIEQMLSANT